MSTQETAALIESVNQMTATVAGKMGQIDLASQQLKSDFDKFMADRERIGDGSPGSRRLNVIQSLVYEGDKVVPDTEKPPGWVPTRSNLYLHIKTKFNTLNKGGMFHFRVQGYAYGQAAIIDETFAGYSYLTTNSIINIGVNGIHEPTVYRAPNGDVYLRLKALNLYFWSFYIDTMNVTGGLPNKGDLQVIVSPNETLNNY